jgi:hypothetical protein
MRIRRGSVSGTLSIPVPSSRIVTNSHFQTRRVLLEKLRATQLLTDPPPPQTKGHYRVKKSPPQDCILTATVSEIHFNIIILSRVGLIYKTGFGLHDWIYCTLYIHNSGLQDDLQTIQFTVEHALGYRVFTSRILATDL